MTISFKSLVAGQEYDRPFLANLWGYQSWHAIGRGIFTPKDQGLMILFVTENKQESLIQYKDRFDGQHLVIEGEIRHGTDQRIANSQQTQDRIFLFHRIKHHMSFVYYGEIILTDYQLRTTEPSTFYFDLVEESSVP